MMTTISGVLSALLALLAIVGTLAGAAGYLKSSLNKARIQQLEGHNKDLTERVQFLEAKDTRLERELEQEKDKVNVLTRIVTRKEEFTELMGKLEEHFEESRRERADILREIRAVRIAS